MRFSPAVATVVKETTRNPKRMQRDAEKQMQENGIGTKSQQALKLQQEQNKQERKLRSREQKEADELRMFELKQQKKRESIRGINAPLLLPQIGIFIAALIMYMLSKIHFI